MSAFGKRKKPRSSAFVAILGIYALSLCPSAPSAARAESSSDQLTALLEVFLAQYPDTLTTWKETNQSLAAIADLTSRFTRPENAFIFGASIAAGASTGALIGQGIAALVTVGSKALAEAITHRRRDAAWLQACLELRPELERSEVATRELEKKLRAEILMRRITNLENVSVDEVLRKLSLQRIQVEADRRDALVRFEALNRGERELVFSEAPSASDIATIRSSKGLVTEDIADFDAWLERNSRILGHLGDQAESRTSECPGMAKDWSRLVSQERDQQNARALILRGEAVWMKAKSREGREASRGYRHSQRSAATRKEGRILQRELNRLEHEDLRPLQQELEERETSSVRACIDRHAGEESQGLLVFRIRYGRYASARRLGLCIEEFDADEDKQRLETRIAAIRARIESVESSLEQLKSPSDESDEGNANLHRMAIETDLAWFRGVRLRYNEVENSRAGQLESLCSEIAQTGCGLDCR